jgi:hypothetical protein
MWALRSGLSPLFRGFVQFLFHLKHRRGPERLTAVVSPHQRRLTAMPFVPATTYGCATLGADGVASKLCLAFLFGNRYVRVQFLNMWGFFGALWCVVTAVPKCPGASIILARTVSDGDVGESHLLPHALFLPQSGMIHDFSRVTSIS